MSGMMIALGAGILLFCIQRMLIICGQRSSCCSIFYKFFLLAIILFDFYITAFC